MSKIIIKNFKIKDTKFFVSASGTSIQINSKNQILKNKRLNIGSIFV